MYVLYEISGKYENFFLGRTRVGQKKIKKKALKKILPNFKFSKKGRIIARLSPQFATV